jgi:hypothetical protein
MAYYLRKKDIPAVQAILHLLENGETRLEGDADRIIYLIQQARNTSFPQLKEYEFRKKEGYVKVTKKIPDNLIKVDEHKEEIDFLGIMQYLIEHKPHSIIFTNVPHISDKDLNRLTQFGVAKQYTVEKDGVQIKCKKESIL